MSSNLAGCAIFPHAFKYVGRSLQRTVLGVDWAMEAPRKNEDPISITPSRARRVTASECIAQPGCDNVTLGGLVLPRKNMRRIGDPTHIERLANFDSAIRRLESSRPSQFSGGFPGFTADVEIRIGGTNRDDERTRVGTVGTQHLCGPAGDVGRPFQAAK